MFCGLLGTDDSAGTSFEDFRTTDAAENRYRIEELERVARAASHALKSYQYGNASPELAKQTADAIDGVLSPAERT
jgi:hypothetical protein